MKRATDLRAHQRFVAVWGFVALVTGACSGTNETLTNGSGDGTTEAVGMASTAAEEEAEAGEDGEPIKIGALVHDVGPGSFPDKRSGLEAAETYINEKMGGVNGRPIVLDYCSTDGSPEKGIECANAFVSDNIPLMFDANDLSSMTAATPILIEAGIPIIGQLAAQVTSASAEYPAAFYFSSPPDAAAVSTIQYLTSVDAKRSMLAVTDLPTTHDYVDGLLAPAFEALGGELQANYIGPENQNFDVIAATQLNYDPDVAGVISLSEDQCTGLLRALMAQGHDGNVWMGACGEFVGELGGEAAGAVTNPRLWVPSAMANAPTEVQEQLEVFIGAMEAIGEDDSISTHSAYSFAGIMTLATILAPIEGEITSEKVITRMTGLRDFPTFLGPKITCDGEQWPGRPANCSRATLYLEAQDDGTLAPLYDEGYVELDPSIMAQ